MFLAEDEATGRMTLTVALWVLGVILLPAIGWAITMFVMTRRLLVMHDDPDKYGFGTVELRKKRLDDSIRIETLIREHTAATRELNSYIRYWIKKTTGEAPPPPEPIG